MNFGGKCCGWRFHVALSPASWEELCGAEGRTRGRSATRSRHPRKIFLLDVAELLRLRGRVCGPNGQRRQTPEAHGGGESNMKPTSTTLKFGGAAKCCGCRFHVALSPASWEELCGAEGRTRGRSGARSRPPHNARSASQGFSRVSGKEDGAVRNTGHFKRKPYGNATGSQFS